MGVGAALTFRTSSHYMGQGEKIMALCFQAGCLVLDVTVCIFIIGQVAKHADAEMMHKHAKYNDRNLLIVLATETR